MKFIYSLCIFLPVIGVFVLVSTLKARKLMRTLGVDIGARQRYNQELDGESVRRIGNATITENWLSHKMLIGTALFPLREIEFFEKGHNSGRYSDSFHVTLLFKEGDKYELPCTFEQQDELMAVLEKRCPQANQRDFGTYL